MILSLPGYLNKGFKSSFILFIIFTLLFSSARASNEHIVIEATSGPTDNGITLGNLNVCTSLPLALTAYLAPTGYSFQKVEWYGNNVLQTTTFHTSDVPRIPINSNVNGGTFTVFAKVYYVSGTQTTFSFSNSITVTENVVALTSITQSQLTIPGCTTSVSFSTGQASGIGIYNPPPDTYTISWTLPAGWTFSGGSTGTSITAIPSSTNPGGNIVATLTMNCGFAASQTLTVATATPPPIFPGGTGPICTGGSGSISINAACGATDYTWSLPGNSGLIFTSNNSQSLTTSATTVNFSASSSAASADVPLSVVANYPNGVSSAAATSNIHVGVPTNSVQIYGQQQGVGICEGSLFNVYVEEQPSDVSSFIWNVNYLLSPASGVYSGQGTTDAYIQLPSGYTYSNDGDVVDGFAIYLQAQNACGISNWESTLSGNVLGCGGTGTRFMDSLKAGIAGTVQVTGLLSMYPNPANGVVNVTVPDSIDVTRVTITLSDIYGRQLKRIATVSNNNTFSLSDLATGIYIVTIYNGKKILSVKKLIKN